MGTKPVNDSFGVKTPGCRAPGGQRAARRAACRRCGAPDIKAVPLDEDRTTAWVCSSCGCQTIVAERQATSTFTQSRPKTLD
ncbi:hypothetical protein [Salinisphaera sp.]|uniref:hypothetical protein n=1 Tax=Salinisphaera sp. TaxID=1914330 RepID=UPI0025E489DB|nr:hypothetical protein [Salinisphaera sp.]